MPDTLEIDESDAYVTKIRDNAQELFNLAEGYLTRRMWPPSLGDTMNGVLIDIDAWALVITNGGGVFNYNDDGQS